MSFSPTIIWLLVGAVLCSSELVLPTAFVAFVMGISAFAVATVAGLIPLNLQILLWAVLSLILVIFSRKLVHSRASIKLDATEGETLTEILPGKTGRVLYEGNSWLARCEDHNLAIAPHQRVYVVGRQGTTLIILPENLLHS